MTVTLTVTKALRGCEKEREEEERERERDLYSVGVQFANTWWVGVDPPDFQD